MAKQLLNVGCVGLGIMGGAFAAHLISAGFGVAGYDLAPSRRSRLRKLAGKAMASAREVAAQSQVVITSLPSVKAFDDALFGANGLAQGMRRGGIVVETSTLPIEVKQRARLELARKGITLLDCPISGTGAQAAAKDIVIYASGPRAAFNRCRGVLAGFARHAYYCGAFGMGSKLKFIANLLVTIHNLSTAEAFVMAERAGVNARLMYQVIRDGAGSSRIFDLRGPMMAARRYLPATMKIAVYQKDIAIIKAFAKSLGAPTPLFAASKRYYDAAMKAGYAQADTAAVHAVLRGSAGSRRRRRKSR